MLGSCQDRGVTMIRKLSIAIVAAAALSGCVTSGYGYRGGAGDYYYGQSSPGHYGYGAPYGNVGYGYPGGLYGSISYGTRYYSPYGYGYGHRYGHPHYYRPGYGYFGPYYPPYRRPVVVRPPHPYPRRPPHDEHPDHQERPDRSGVPWRDLDRLGERKGGLPRAGMPRPTPARPEVAQFPSLAPRPAGSTGMPDNTGTRPRGDAAVSPARRMVRPQAERPAPRSRGVSQQDEIP
ncbi:hypothetical protein BH23PSE2_BH23PSE2_10220 [soil metagenome]